MIGRDRDERLGGAGDVIESAENPFLTDSDRRDGQDVVGRTFIPGMAPAGGQAAVGGGRWDLRQGPFLQPAKTLGMTVVSRLRKDAALRTVPGPRLSRRRGDRLEGGSGWRWWTSRVGGWTSFAPTCRRTWPRFS